MNERISHEPDTASSAYKLAAYAISMTYRLGDLDRDLPIKLTGSGLENLQENGPCVLAYTHHNPWDLPALGTVVYRYIRRPVRFMAKEELLDERKFTGRLLTSMHALPVKRGSPSIAQMRNALNVLDSGHILGIAAEGGRVDGDRIAEIQDGAGFIATKAQVDIIPVGIAGPNWRVRGRRMPYIPRPIHVHFGEAIFSDDSSKSGREYVRERLSTDLQRALDVSYAAYEEVHGSKAAKRLDRGLAKLF